MASIASRGNTVVSTTGTTWATTNNAFDGAVGTNPATYATWVNATGSAVGTITIGGYSFTGTSGTNIINSVTADIRHIDNAANRIASVTVQLKDSGGTNIGAAATGTLNATVHTDTLTLGTATAAQVVAGLQVLVTITKTSQSQSTTFSLDQVDVTVNYTDPAQFFAMRTMW